MSDTVRYLAKCKSCGKGCARDFQTQGGNRIPVVLVAYYELSPRTEYQHLTEVSIWEAGERGLLRCTCGRALRTWSAVKARRTKQPCGAKCLAATGASCDCACGGKNHGAQHL